jgi:hypothetical protein
MKSLLVGLFFFFLIIPSAFAEEELRIDVVATPSMPPEVNYTLPYPGILPDNPLYPLKAARDRVISFFISDPIKKADFDLLQADKRIQAGVLLLRKDNPDTALAITTISKGQNYFEEAVHAYHEAQKVKKPIEIGDLPDRLNRAARKYAEVLTDEEHNLPKEKREAFASLVTRSEKLVSFVPAHSEK